ncbi:D-isomer specific 2-hydroxyacid dehydrogenase [Schizophyllum amplum]|uniref:D-isomer specific 2-hydroxyacid dehydrogenase n=1 Tax=Schizophyllum amplum TaxID=97359 RepID=A0A550C634_9AGAR|nr:D-isomer specific 2-hydroxyacid dehydrogenase [Auriculariopsis ampla]
MAASEGRVRVAILDDYQNVALTLADWSSVESRAAIDVYNDTIHDEDALVERLAKYEIICAMRERTKFNRALLDRLPNLKYIATTGMKNRGIDIGYATEKGIVVSGTTGGGSSTVEHIWALILAAAREIPREHDSIRRANPQWQTVVPFGLQGKTLGLVGLGRLGSKVAEIAKVFDMHVVAWSPHLTEARAAEHGVQLAKSKHDLFKASDIVSVQMVLSEETRGMITGEDLRMMQPTAIFVNTSRGPLVDETALVDVLSKGKIRCAALDVYDVEPLPLDHPLRRLDNVVLSPHNGYVNDTSYEAWYKETVENIVAYLDGKPQRILS